MKNFLPEALVTTNHVLELVQLGLIGVLYIFWFLTKYNTNMKIQIADENSLKRRRTRGGGKVAHIVLWGNAFFSDSNMV